ncbi:MAG: hypothetical protein QM796_00190 [Chthoniobacteraceae bacterium]
MQFLLPGSAHHAAAGAIAAVAGATVSDQKQNAIGIAVNQPRHRHVRILPTRVGHLGGRDQRLLKPRDHLAADWIVGIVRVNQVEKMRRDPHRQLVGREKNSLALLLQQRQFLLDLTQAFQAVFKLPFPIVPLFGRDIRPMPRSMCDKSFVLRRRRFCG